MQRLGNGPSPTGVKCPRREASSLPTFRSTLESKHHGFERVLGVLLPLAPFRGEGVGG